MLYACAQPREGCIRRTKIPAFRKLSKYRDLDHLTALHSGDGNPSEATYEQLLSPGSPWGVLVLSHKIGSGEFSEVFKCTDMRDGTQVAAKSIIRQNPNDPKEAEHIAREVALQLKVSAHPNVAKCYGLYEETAWTHWFKLHGKRNWIVMEFVPKGTLQQHLREQFPSTAGEGQSVGTNDEAAVAKWMRQLVGALDHLHKHRVVFRDVKAANICLDANRNLKLLDFGSAVHLPADADHVEEDAVVGSPEYMAPDAWGLRYSPAVDMFGAGAVAYEIAYGHTPYYWVASKVGELLSALSSDPAEQEGQIKQATQKIKAEIEGFTVPYPAKASHTFSDDFKSFVAKLLQPQPGERGSAAEMLAHPFLR